MILIKAKPIIWISTAVMALLLVISVFIFTSTVDLFTITIYCDDTTEYIKPWKGEDGNLYIFLPSCVQLQDAVFRLDTDTEVSINGSSVYQNMPCSDYSCDVSYDLEYRVLGIKQKKQLSFIQSCGVATMFIVTETGSMDYVHDKKGNEENGSVRLYETDGTLNSAANELTIKGRGNASWTNSEKKPYTITLSQEVDFLGLGAAQKWILLTNASDHSHIRNKMVYDFASEIGLPYAPDCQWVDLYLNGEYAGLYLLSEKNEVHQERVNLTSDQGFLMSLERSERLEAQGIAHIATDSGQTLRIQYPEQANEELQSTLDVQWQAIENAILSEDGIDPVSDQHFCDMADLDSWVQNYLIDEIFGNMDGFIVSRYFYYDPAVDGKVYAGPVWDYDLAVGNDTDAVWSITDPRVQMLYRYAYDPQSELLWAQELYEHSWFRERLIEIFETEMLPAVDRFVSVRILDYADQIRAAAQMDRVRWLLGEEGNFDQEVSQVVTYLSEHTLYLKEIWLDENSYCQVSALKTGRSLFFTVPSGGCLEELPDIQDWSSKTFAGWYYCDTNEPFDMTQPITEDIQIYAKWEDSAVQKVKQLANMFPLGVLAVIGLVFVAVDWRRNRKSGRAYR